MRLLLILIVLGGVWKFYFDRDVDLDQAVAEQGTPEGFVPVYMPDAASSGAVYIMTPPNCPSDKAQRARDLARQLDARGIPYTTGSSYQGRITDPDQESVAAMERGLAVVDEGPPAVFVNGYGKSDPTTSDVIQVYKRTR